MVALSSSQSKASVEFRFTVNSAGKNKDWDFKLLASRYEDKQGTIHDVARHVKAGHALCAGLLGGKWRSKANVLGSQVILLDIDNSDVLRDELGQPVKGEDGKAIKIYKHQLTIEEALAHPFIRQHCALVYTTSSHKPDWHKLRLVFILPEYLEGADTVEACTRFLMQHLPHDRACKDASRVFYGNTLAEFPLINPDAVLPIEWVQQAREAAEIERAEYQRRVEEVTARRQQFKDLAEAESWDVDQLIQQALDYIPPRSLGSGNYQECISVLMALVNHYGATEAGVIAERWSPSIPGSTWNISQKIRSLREGRSGGITIGTLFHIAKQYGFSFPTRTDYEYKKYSTPVTEPDDDEYEEYLRQSQEQEQWDEEYSSFRNARDLEGFLGATLSQVKKFAATKREYKGFGEVSLPPVNKEGEIAFKAGERVKTVSALVSNAAKEGRRLIILDRSDTGTGKSHQWGEIPNDVLGVNKLFYCSPNHRNPTVATVEQNFTDVPVRHNGLFQDDAKSTPLGAPHVRWAKHDETPNLQGNCGRADLFSIFRSKGFTEANFTASTNPICQTCDFVVSCSGAKDEKGERLAPVVLGNTYRSDRTDALQTERNRLALDSLPDITDLKTPQENQETSGEATEPPLVGLILDEFAGHFRPTNLTEVALKDFDSTVMYFESRKIALEEDIEKSKVKARDLVVKLEACEDKQEIKKITQDLNLELDLQKTFSYLLVNLPDALTTVRPVIHVLRRFLAGEIKPTQESYYGWNETQLREKIALIPEEKLVKAIEILSGLSPSLNQLLDVLEADSVNMDRVEGPAKEKKGLAPALKFIRSILRTQSVKESFQRIRSMPSNWLVPILGILSGDRGSFRIKHGILEVVTPNERHKEQLLAADLTVVLDATLSRKKLAQDLGIDETEIVVIRQEAKSYKNLTVVQVVGLGKLIRDRSPQSKERLEALLAELGKKHPDHAVIDHLSTKREGEGHWFSDSRGTNAYQGKEALVTIGTPHKDIGMLAMEFATLTGDKNATKENPAFEEFVREAMQSEVIQSGGRLRAHLRPEENLHWYVVTTEDMEFLRAAFPDAQFQQKSAFEITPLAGTKSEQTFQAVVAAAKKLWDQGEKITQAAIAERCDRIKTQGAVSKSIAKNEILAKLGGTKALEKIFQALLNGLNRGRNILDETWKNELSSDQIAAVELYLPLFLEENLDNMGAVAAECVQMAGICGWQGIRAFLASLLPEQHVNMLSWLIDLLHPDWRSQFLELVQN